jgi:hypothetical protein
MSKKIDLSEQFLSPADFYQKIEDIVWLYDVSWMEAIVMFTEEKNLDIEAVVPLIQKHAKLKDCLAQDAEALNFLPKTNRIPGV